MVGAVVAGRRYHPSRPHGGCPLRGKDCRHASNAYPGGVNLDLLRSFFVTVRQGSLSKAADELRLAQSTLTRQMSALEHEVGGALLARGPAGVELTPLGHALRERMAPVLDQFDAALEEVRRRARGQDTGLRVGYLLSATADHLNPVLARFRREHPEVKLALVDLSPGEQLRALRAGAIDLALTGHGGEFNYRDLYVRRIATVPCMAALAETHPLAAPRTLRFADLRSELFVGAQEADLPGFNRWIGQVARRAGFRLRFAGYADSLTHSLSMVVLENAVALLPAYSVRTTVPGVVFRPLADAERLGARWDLLVAWPRGKVSGPLKALIDAFAPPGRAR